MGRIGKPVKSIYAVGTETPKTNSRRKPDNLDLDSREALALGYGCHYGKYKADHPKTKEMREGGPIIPQGNEVLKYCPACGGEFATIYKHQKFCCANCREKATKRRYREKYQGNKEVAASAAE